MSAQRYVDRGSGPAVVLSHGTLMDHTMFEPQIAALENRYRVVAFDHRARTERWHGPYDIDDLVDDCIALLDELEIERCVLGGMSLGGFMALALALRHPERLDGLMLIGSMAQDYSAEEKADIDEHLELLLREETVSEEFAAWERDLVMGATTRRESPALVRHWIDRWKTRRSAAVAAEFRSWMHKEDLTPRLAEIEIPALVVHGAEDAVLPIERGRAMAEALPNARLVAIERAGHTSTVEAPAAVTGAIERFLEEIYGARD
jgi:pimeloyl-ACP methyl ester carboxylesterase